MNEAKVEFGLFMGECRNCRHGFVYSLGNAQKANEQVPPKSRSYHVGSCPACAAPIKIPVAAN
jgi:hypothetical protein